jgi:probable FeS assembly SUF system protein SufT
MNLEQEITLNRDTLATIIPAGEEHTITAGTVVTISQALGGAVTVRTAEGLYRIPSIDWDALGTELKEYLNETATQTPQATSDKPFSDALVWDALKQCFDPEIPLNIVDLGLIYDLKISEPSESGNYQVNVQMTLTAQGCGMGPVIADDAKQQIELIPEVESANVSIIWEPPWNPHMISEPGRKQLGLE